MNCIPTNKHRNKGDVSGRGKIKNHCLSWPSVDVVRGLLFLRVFRRLANDILCFALGSDP